MRIRYILFKIRKKYQYHKKLYVVFVMELAFGMAFVFLALNYHFFYKQEIRKEKERQKGKELVLSVDQADVMGQPYIPDKEDVQMVQSLFGEAAECMIAVQKIKEIDNELCEYYYLYTNKWKEETVLPEVSMGGKVNMENVKTFPLERFFGNIEKETCFSVIRIEKNDRFSEKLEVLLKYFGNKYKKEYRFYFSNEYVQKKYQVEYLSMIPNYLGKVASVLLVIMLLGGIGVMKLLFLKRRKRMAVSLACGAEYWELSVEIIGEMLGICLAGGGIGTAIGYGFTRMIDFGLPIQIDANAFLYVIMITLVMVAILSSSSVWELKKKSIYELLRERQ